MSVPDEDNSRSPSFALRKVEGTKRVTRNRTSSKDRQHNGKKETSTKKQTMIYKILMLVIYQNTTISNYVSTF